jgi:hypothetical protein
MMMILNRTMKYSLQLFLLLISAFVAKGQIKGPIENVIITSQKEKTRVYTENGELRVNVSPKDVLRL